MPVPDIDLNKWPETRPQLDVESVVMDLFTRSFEGDADWSHVLVFNEIDVDVDAYANVTDVVIFHCLPPRFASGNHRGAVWTCSLSILVESVDADRAFALASHVRSIVMRWPFMQAGEAGRVLRVRVPPSFAKAAGGKQATSKRIKQYATASDCVLMVRDMF